MLIYNVLVVSVISLVVVWQAVLVDLHLQLLAELSVVRAAFLNSVVFKRLPSQTLESCSTQCSTRRRCKKALYNRAAKVCSLVQALVNSTVDANRGEFFLTGFDDLRMVASTCGGYVCTLRETCVNDDIGLYCKPTVNKTMQKDTILYCDIPLESSQRDDSNECPVLTSNLFYNTYGNIYDVNSTLKALYMNTGRRVLLTCSPSGTWTAHDAPGCCHVGCTTGLASWLHNGLTITVYCDMDTDDGHWMVFQRRIDGSLEFYSRPWTEYENGFGNLEGEFWLGLENMNMIVSAGNFELRVELEDFAGDTRYAKYSYFRIADVSDKYRMQYSTYSGTAGDSLLRQNGSQFSTYDQDNDVWANQCAVIFQGAWWYSSCHDSNLNAKYYPNGGNVTTMRAKHVHWRHWHDFWFSLKSTEMKFRQMP